MKSDAHLDRVVDATAGAVELLQAVQNSTGSLNRLVGFHKESHQAIAGPAGSGDPGDSRKKYSQQSYGAHFAEVGVNSVTGEIRLRRMLGVFTAGRILNAKTARSQAIGGMTFGVGAALMEAAVIDKRYGYFVNHDLAEYHVVVHADVPAIDAVFLPELDDLSSPMKSKGIGELGICGAGAAVANAVYNATGIRIRDYPLTLDKVLNVWAANDKVERRSSAAPVRSAG